MSLFRAIFTWVTATLLSSIATVATADCGPIPLNVDPGSTVVCSGTDADGFLNPAFDLITDSEGNITATDVPVDNLTVNILSGAVVNDSDAGVAIALANGGHRLLNEGTIRASTFGIGSDGGGLSINNAGNIIVNGGGAEGIGLRGSEVIVTNRGTGYISATGYASEGIGVFAPGANVTNFGAVEVIGAESEGIGVEGVNAIISNSGNIFVEGEYSEAFGVEGSNAEITNSGNMRAIGPAAEAIGLEGQGTINNSGALLTEGKQSVGIGALGNMIQVVNGGNILQSGIQTIGIGMIGSSTELLLISGSSLTSLGEDAIAVALAGGAVPGTLALTRGSGSNVFTNLDAQIDLGGAGATGFLLFHDNAVFDNFGRLVGTGTSATGMHFTGNDLDINAAGEMIMSGANSTGFALGTANALTSGISRDAEVTIAGSFKLLGADSVAIDVAGENHQIANTALIETSVVDGSGIRIIGTDHTFTNESQGVVQNGGITVSGDKLTLNNEGEIHVKGITIDDGSGSIEVLNTGLIEIGDGASFGLPQFSAVNFKAGGGTVENQNQIIGNVGSVGFFLSGVDQPLTITNSTGIIDVETILAGIAGPDLTFINNNNIAAQLGIGVVTGTHAQIENTGNIVITALNSSVQNITTGLGVNLLVDERAEFTNSGNLSVDSAITGDFSAVFLGSVADNASLTNSGEVVMVSTGTASAVKLTGRTVSASNAGGAIIGVDSAGGGTFEALGLSATDNIQARNDGELIASGTNGRGIGVLTQTPETTFSIINSGSIEVTGKNSTGVFVEGFAELSEIGGGVPSQRVLANEDTIVVTGTNSRGMVLGPEINSTRLENAGRFDVAGDNAKGIDVMQGDANFILNANGFRVAGDNAVGISLQGDRNTVLNGQDAAVFPGAAGLITPDGYYTGDAPLLGQVTVVSAFIDLADSNLGNIPVQGDLVVTGPNAVGIDVNGDGNRIANVPGFGRDGSLPNIGEGTPIFAQGVNSVGVRINGSDNVLLNEGTISGESYAILDGDGGNTFINGGYLFGDVDLAGGDDTMIIREGGQINGLVRGGGGDDRLIAAMRAPLPGDPVDEDTISGDRFTGFENFTKVGDNRLIINGTLDVATALIQRGELRLGNNASITGNTTVRSNGLLTGTGLFGNLTILDDGTGSVGSSAGRWDIAGDLNVFGGILELEIGPTFAESDFITVGGTALFDVATIRLLFLDDFIPASNEVFDVLLAEQILGFDTISFDVFGLASGFGLLPSFDNLGRLGFSTVAIQTSVPEPASGFLLALGLLGLVLTKRRSRKLSDGE